MLKNEKNIDQCCFLWAEIRGFISEFCLFLNSEYFWLHRALIKHWPWQQKATENSSTKKGKWEDICKKRFQSLVASFPLLLHAIESLHSEAKASSFGSASKLPSKVVPLSYPLTSYRRRGRRVSSQEMVSWPTPAEKRHLLSGMRRLRWWRPNPLPEYWLFRNRKPNKEKFQKILKVRFNLVSMWGE